MIERIVKALGQRAIDYYDREPVRVHAAVTTAVLALAATLGLVLDSALVSAGILVLVPLVVGEVRNAVASPATQRELASADPGEPAHP